MFLLPHHFYRSEEDSKYAVDRHHFTDDEDDESEATASGESTHEDDNDNNDVDEGKENDMNEKIENNIPEKNEINEQETKNIHNNDDNVDDNNNKFSQQSTAVSAEHIENLPVSKLSLPLNCPHLNETEKDSDVESNSLLTLLNQTIVENEAQSTSKTISNHDNNSISHISTNNLTKTSHHEEDDFEVMTFQKMKLLTQRIFDSIRPVASEDQENNTVEKNSGLLLVIFEYYILIIIFNLIIFLVTIKEVESLPVVDVEISSNVSQFDQPSSLSSSTDATLEIPSHTTNIVTTDTSDNKTVTTPNHVEQTTVSDSSSTSSQLAQNIQDTNNNSNKIEDDDDEPREIVGVIDSDDELE